MPGLGTVSVLVVVGLAACLIFGLFAFNTVISEGAKVAAEATPSPEPASTPTPKPTVRFTVEGPAEFVFGLNNETVKVVSYMVTNVLSDEWVNVQASATAAEAYSVSWDKTMVALQAGKSTVFTLTVVSFNSTGTCRVTFMEKTQGVNDVG